MKIGLTIKAIIRWEQLRKKSFSLMDYTDKDDVDSLLYTATICNNEGEMYTLDVFRQILSNEELTRKMVHALERETAVLRQFQKEQEVTDLNKNETNPAMIGELVSTLVLSGLDAHYALEEMELCDLPMYIEAYDRKKKEELENNRFWTYFNILPHIDGKKLPSPRDLYSFPWEELEDIKEAERALEEDADIFNLFMENGINIIKSN